MSGRFSSVSLAAAALALGASAFGGFGGGESRPAHLRGRHSGFGIIKTAAVADKAKRKRIAQRRARKVTRAHQ